MLPNNFKSPVIGGFLNAVFDLSSDDPDAQRRITDAQRNFAGEPEPHLEEQRREALAQWATHRWAPICLRLAGFEQTADLMVQCPDAEAAADTLDDLSVAVPPDCRGNPTNLDEVAGRAAWGAAGAGAHTQKCIGPAFAVKMAHQATRRSHAGGMCPSVLSIGTEAALAAAKAMDGHGPENAQVYSLWTNGF